MFATISFVGKLNIDRCDIEDELESAFHEIGEITGAGVGRTGSHLDIDVTADVSAKEVFDRIEKVLSNLKVSTPAKIMVGPIEFYYL